MKFSRSLKLNHIFQRLYHTGGHANSFLVLYARRNRSCTNRVGSWVMPWYATGFAEDCGKSTV